MRFDTSYSDLLRDPRWQRKRLEIMQRDDFACHDCRSSTKELQVRHKHYRKGKKPWEYSHNELVTLCRPCHEKVTGYQNEIKDILGEIPIDQLYFVVDQLKRNLGYKANPLQATIEYCDKERSRLIALTLTKSISRQLDAIDALAEDVWELIDASIPRHYG